MENLLLFLFLVPSISFFKTNFVNKLKLVLFIDKSLGWMNKEDRVKTFFKFKF
jgi:hypothetical protein